MNRLIKTIIIAALLLTLPRAAFCQSEFSPAPLYNIEGYEGAGQFQRIYSLHVDEDFERVIILSGDPLNISVFNLLDGSPIVNISIFGDAAPPYTAFGCGRYVYFSHAGGIERFGEDGRRDKWTPPAGFPLGADKAVCGRGGSMTFLLRKSNTVEKYGADGKLIFSIHPYDMERRKRGEPEVNSIADLCAGPGEALYVADSGAGEVRRYDEKGNFAGTTGGDRELEKAAIDELALVAVDFNRSVWMYDAGNSKIKVFDSFGFYLGEWKATADDGTQNFISPAALFVDRFDHVFLLDDGTATVRVFDARGVF